MIEIEKKYKIVLICHFTNIELQNIIKPFKKIQEMAPWILPLIKLFENDDKFSLYVISPHEYINKTKHFNLRGVNYYFYNAHMPIIGRHWPRFFKWDYLSNFWYNKKITEKIVNGIQPDIIHLFGAENAYYSSTILQFKNKYPVGITIQGFIHKTSNKNNYVIKKRIEIEHKIISSFNNFLTHTDTTSQGVQDINPSAKIRRVNFPMNPPKLNNNNNIKKKYDIVFFARLSRDKGLIDLFKALNILKKKNKDINLCVIGLGKIQYFKNKAKEYGVYKNVIWTGYLPTQKDVWDIVSQAKISVLPTYHDLISGTIIESLFLKIPVVAYDVGDIHKVNEKEEIISLVDKLDVEGLAKAIEELLDNPELRKIKAEKGYKRAYEMFAHSNEEIRESLLKSYGKVINDFNRGNNI